MKTFTYTTRCKTILGDLHTPVSTYLKVRDIFPQSALMESSDYHGSENNRSFIGLNPVASIGINHGTATATYPDGSMEEHPISEHFRADHAISDFLNRFKVSGEYNNYCGLYGYTTFNAVRYFEHINVKDSRDPKNDAPDMLYILYKYLIVFNDFRNEMLLLEMLQDGEDSHLDYVEKAIHNRNYTTYDFRAVGETTSTLTDEERAKFSRVLESGFIDTFRYFYPEQEGIYSWWSYRFKAREKNAGWRIDYFCVSESLKDRLEDAKIHTEIFGSDHCPVELDICL